MENNEHWFTFQCQRHFLSVSTCQDRDGEYHSHLEEMRQRTFECLTQCHINKWPSNELKRKVDIQLGIVKLGSQVNHGKGYFFLFCQFRSSLSVALAGLRANLLPSQVLGFKHKLSDYKFGIINRSQHNRLKPSEVYSSFKTTKLK